MFIHLYRFSLTGEVTRQFALIVASDPRDKDAELDEEKIKKTLREDREANIVGKGIPDTNPSEDPSVVKYFYTPSLEKQRLYARRFPIHVGTYEIIDAFTCLGSRFGLEALTVYVELCRSGMGGGCYWSNIYYVADSQVPACIMKIDRITMQVDTQDILARIQRDQDEDAAGTARQKERNINRCLTRLTSEFLVSLEGTTLSVQDAKGNNTNLNVQQICVVDTTLLITAQNSEGEGYTDLELPMSDLECYNTEGALVGLYNNSTTESYEFFSVS